ncbi:signal peptide peptidase SppA [Avibacterium gallinarum]|uniref:Protease 4 n=1 Tax=Avibacterium gallinarum TaxID=755 RepID=A0A379AVT0_AVIGA|nr:signal peptide peptidase SppA [Avibacterium gallinarum]POY45097.1 signal peptide peptidase SppA [Avibacterium gallinarum]TDP28781.1 protease-4 [Avibacterium gallinarum]SUB26436.1 protease 4 [Avibacterium gallinarum]
MKSLMKLGSMLWRGLNFVRNVVMNLVFLVFVLFLFTVVSLLTNANKETQAPLSADEGALLLNLDGYLADNREEIHSLQDLLKEVDSQYVPRQISTFDLVYSIRSAVNDPRIKGLVLDLNRFEGADLPAIKYVGKAINQFKQSGKPVIAYADSYTQKQYVLASYADEIYLNPIGAVEIQGLALENLYYKDLLDKLKITPHIFRVGTYKSAVEPFLRNDMSAEARANMQRWLSTMWTDYKTLIATNRQIPVDNVLPEAEQYFANLKALNGDLTAYAQQQKFVTQLADRFTLEQKLTALFGKNAEGKAKLLPFDRYLADLPDRIEGEGKTRIAVVNVEGAIIDGETDDNGVGGDTIATLLRQAYEDEKIKAVILRVNSPGGSAFASEIIRQEIVHLQQAGKPVVVSMGAMAASGGYWISSTADYILADADTITGSIGIFAMFPTFEKAVAEIGVNADGVATSPLSQQSSFGGISKVKSDLYQLEIEHGYDKFLSLVSKGRQLAKTDVDKIAQGQVWLGSEALQNKLVDELGDFDRAVEKAKELAKAKQGEQSAEEFSVEWLIERNDSMLDALVKSFGKGTQQQLFSALGLAKPFNEVKQQLNQLSQFNDPKGQYLYCINCGTLR